MSGGRPPRRPIQCRLASIWTRIIIGLSALAITSIALPATSSPRQAAAVAGPCPAQFTIDFAGLPQGTIIGEQYAGLGVHITAVANGSMPNALIVVDSNGTDTNLDSDLRVGIGNVAILAKNLTDVDPADGFVDHPDENDFGGKAIIAFDQPVSIGAFTFVDKDHGTFDRATAYDATGDILVSVEIPQAGDGSVQTIQVGADGVHRFELAYRDSGAFTGITVECKEPSITITAPPSRSDPVVLTVVEGPVSLPKTGGQSADDSEALSWVIPLLALSLVAGGAFVGALGMGRQLTLIRQRHASSVARQRAHAQLPVPLTLSESCQQSDRDGC